MSLAEIRKAIDNMTEEERFFTAAYLKHLSEVNDPARRATLGDRMRRMDAGQKYSLEQALRIHDALNSEGV